MLKEFNPTTPSQRKLIRLKTNHLSKSPLLKFKLLKLPKSSGRNNTGKITVYHKGGGVKKLYRKIDFTRIKPTCAIVVNLEYDPYRNSEIAAIFDYQTKKFSYIIKPKNLKLGDIVEAGTQAKIKLGNSLPILKIPVGSYIHNVSTKYGKPAAISRAAGNFSQILEKTRRYARIKLPSNEQRHIPLSSFATIGLVSNELHLLTNLGKAGRSRWLNRRPVVRGVAMNPIDHPHGGGEGKTSGGRTSVTPWGKPSKDKKTSTSKNKLILIQHYKK